MFPEIKKLFMLDPDITFLNHGSFGACPKPIFDKYIQFQKQLEKEPVRLLAYDVFPLLEKSRDALSKFISCNKDDLIFSPNPSTALNTVIKSLNLKENDEILTTNHEYGALDRTWNFICKKTGAKYIQKTIKLPLNSKEEFINDFKKGINEKTKIIFLSHITSSTALIFPVEEICKLAKENNILCIIDGAHVPAHIKLNIKKLNPDIYVGACHKWMCSPKGVSFLYVKKELQKSIDPLVVSWGYESDEPSHSQFLDYHQWQGTKDMSAYLTIPDTIKFLKHNNWENVSKKCRETNLWARNEINHLLNKEALCDEKFLGQMSSIRIDQDATIDYHIYFYKKYKIQLPFIKWNDQSFIRISLQAYNSIEDINILIDALKKEID